MQAFVPKNRRPRFDFVLRIIDLNNIPLVNGTAFVKWRLPSSSAAVEHHGQTDKAVIIDHRAHWNYEKTLHVRLTIDRNQMLQECEIHFEILQDFAGSAGSGLGSGSGGGGGHGHGGDRDLLGRIRLNLAEYVNKSDEREDEGDEEEGIVRRYLMQDSKINSTLRVGVVMKQVEGDTDFSTPPLKSAMVFGGIAGVVSSEQGDPDDISSGPLPSINTKTSETADMQDLYRRTLAASWNSRSSDLPADKLIEDLFSGGSGWHDETQPARVSRLDDNLNVAGPTTPDPGAQQQNRLSPGFERRPRSPSSNRLPSDAKSPELLSAANMGATNGRRGGSIEQQIYDNSKAKGFKSRAPEHELSEFDVREDLRSWEISPLD